MRRRRFQVLQAIYCCSPLLRLQVRGAMGRMSSFVQDQTNTHRCSPVWRIGVCRCHSRLFSSAFPSGLRRQAGLRALRSSARRCEASSCARRWPSLPPSLQTLQARLRCRAQPTASPCSIPQESSRSATGCSSRSHSAASRSRHMEDAGLHLRSRKSSTHRSDGGLVSIGEGRRRRRVQWMG